MSEPQATPRVRLAKRTAVAAGLAAVLAVSGCATGDSVADRSDLPLKEGGVLNVGIPGDPGSLDPTMAYTLASISVFNSMCELLYNAYEDGVIYPQLAAEMPEFNEDNTVATIALREGVTFHDGTPMDADAVKFSLDRHLSHPSSQRTNELDAVESVEVVDDLTINVHMKETIAPGAFDGIFTDRGGTIVSPTAVEELGDEAFAASPVCVGPFKFESRVAQDSVTLVKDEGYYDADKVKLDSIVYRVMADSTVRATNLRSGDLDVIERLAPTDVASIEADPDLDIRRYAGLGFYNLIFNIGNVNGVLGEPGQVDTPLASDPRIRKAFEMSIDREALNEVVYFGQFAPACGFMAPSSPLASDQTLSCVEYDPEGAKELLESTGVDLPFQIEISLDQQPEFRRMGEMIQSMAAEVGFEVLLDVGESTAVIDRAHNGDFQVYFNSWSGHLDTDSNVSYMTKSDSPRSVGKYNNAEVDALLVKARSTIDVEERSALYDEIDRILKEETPYVFLLRPTNINGVNADVVGVEFRPTSTVAPAFAAFVDR